MENNNIAEHQKALEEFRNSPESDLSFYSSIPDECTKKLCYVGIDEAGRGPVLGPMVYGIFCAVMSEDEAVKFNSSKNQAEDSSATPLKNIEKLNDSKQVTEKIREQIFATLNKETDNFCYGIKIISPISISSKCFRRQKNSLNEVSHDAAIELIRGILERGVRIGRVFVDTVGPMDKYQKKLEGLFPDLKFKVDKKADSKYKPVSAASICAKVSRDECLKNWIGGKGPFGSGYPADPVTKEFLKKNTDIIFGFPNVVRNSWSTAQKILEQKAVKVKWESDETEESESSGPKIYKYLTKSSKGSDNKTNKVEKIETRLSRPKSQFFHHRHLHQVVKL